MLVQSVGVDQEKAPVLPDIDQRLSVPVPSGHASMVSFIYYPLPFYYHAVLVYKDGSEDKELWNGLMVHGRRPAESVIVLDCAHFLVLFSQWEEQNTTFSGFKLLFTFMEVRYLLNSGHIRIQVHS